MVVQDVEMDDEDERYADYSMLGEDGTITYAAVRDPVGGCLALMPA